MIKVIFIVLIILLVYYLYTTNATAATPEPTPSTSACASYDLTSTGLSNACLREIWAGQGCTTADTKIPDTYNGWWNQQPYQKVFDDMGLWASLKTDMHRSSCYGPDKSLWPA